MIRNLLSIRDLDPEGIEKILATASSLADVGSRQVKKYPTLRGRTIVNLFYESSTRTLVGRRVELLGVGFQRRKRRIIEGHRADHRGNGRRLYRRPS